MTRYESARDRLAAILENLNTDDASEVELRYMMTVEEISHPDAEPLLGTLLDGDLVALAEHRCGAGGL